MIRPIQIDIGSLVQMLLMSADISRGSVNIYIDGDVSSDSLFPAGNSDLNNHCIT
jgi:hypothetical protein